MNNTRILVGQENFQVGEEYQWLAGCDDDGAVVTFTGKVRNHNLGDKVSGLTLEHYPGMTEKALAEIVSEARSRWPLQRVTVIHRVGELQAGEPPLSVVVTIPVNLEPRKESEDITRPSPCPPPKATIRSRSASVRLRIIYPY